MSSDHYDAEYKRGYISAPDVRAPARATTEPGEDVQQQPRRPSAGHEGMDDRTAIQRRVDEGIDDANKDVDLKEAQGPSKT